jgi:serine phosphatase RsbU (regulator of sigma subunit)
MKCTDRSDFVSFSDRKRPNQPMQSSKAIIGDVIRHIVKQKVYDDLTLVILKQEKE